MNESFINLKQPKKINKGHKIKISTSKNLHVVTIMKILIKIKTGEQLLMSFIFSDKQIMMIIELQNTYIELHAVLNKLQ